MKKLFLAFSVALLMASCGHKSETTAVGENTETKIEEVAEGNVAELTDDGAFRPGGRVDIPTIIDFNATWCGPCRAFKPLFHAAAAKYPQVRFVSIDVDNNQHTAEAYGVTAIPTVVFIKPDGSMTRYVGLDDLMPAEKFDALIEALIK